MTIITQTAANTFIADNGRGTSLTLVKKDAGYWQVMAENAATRAWRSMGVKTFWALEDVEKSYKSFRGLAALLS